MRNQSKILHKVWNLRLPGHTIISILYPVIAESLMDQRFFEMKLNEDYQKFCCM